MDKPNIRRLPTSQMQAFCDLLGLGKEVQGSMASMIEVLEKADFSNLEVAFTPDESFIRPALEK